MKIKVTLGHIAKSTELGRQHKLRSESCPIAVALNACTDCLHAVPFEYPHNLAISRALARCALTPIVLNTVTNTGQHRFCAQERHDGECGPEGRRFEKKVEASV